MWKKEIVFTLAVTTLVLTGCSPGVNNFSKSNQPDNDTSPQLAQLTSDFAKELQ